MNENGEFCGLSVFFLFWPDGKLLGRELTDKMENVTDIH